MDFPNMESECRGRREAFKRIWSQRSARYSALQGGVNGDLEIYGVIQSWTPW